MNHLDEEMTEEGALAFARTLRHKSHAEAIGHLMIAGIDLASAEALLLIVSLEARGEQARQ